MKGELPPILMALENHLSGRTFLVGERLTIADISLACIFVDMFRSVSVLAPCVSCVLSFFYSILLGI